MIAELKQALERAESIALICHVSPDMDTLGSAVGLKMALEKMGKRVKVYAQDEVPKRYLFLEGVDAVQQPDEEKFDLCVAIDVSDEERMGSARTIFDRTASTALIDHHPTTVPFAQISVLRPQAAATAQIIVDLMQTYGWEISARAAMCLWAGISTDTGNFSFDSVRGETFRAAAICVDCGAQPGMITEKLYRTSTEGHIRAMGRVLNGLRLSREGRVCILCNTHRDVEECHATQEDLSGIINQAQEIESVQAVAHLSEREGFIKCSLRAKAPLDVAKVAQKFGGGGHVRAAGCSFYGLTMEEASAVMERALAEIVQ